MNSGPGSLGGFFIHEKHHKTLKGLRGWWGNKFSSRFEMKDDFEPEEGVSSFVLSTPNVLSMKSVNTSLLIFD
jgi:kynureninase